MLGPQGRAGAVTTPHGSRARGECLDAAVSSHTDRSFHARKPRKAHSNSCMARFLNAVAFFSLALRPRTRRNALRLQTCTRTLDPFFVVEQQADRRVLPKGSAAFIPVHACRGLPPRVGKSTGEDACGPLLIADGPIGEQEPGILIGCTSYLVYPFQ